MLQNGTIDRAETDFTFRLSIRPSLHMAVCGLDPAHSLDALFLTAAKDALLGQAERSYPFEHATVPNIEDVQPTEPPSHSNDATRKLPWRISKGRECMHQATRSASSRIRLTVGLAIGRLQKPPILSE